MLWAHFCRIICFFFLSFARRKGLLLARDTGRLKGYQCSSGKRLWDYLKNTVVNISVFKALLCRHKGPVLHNPPCCLSLSSQQPIQECLHACLSFYVIISFTWWWCFFICFAKAKACFCLFFLFVVCQLFCFHCLLLHTAY